jgi:hypothetical protein
MVQTIAIEQLTLYDNWFARALLDMLALKNLFLIRMMV